MNLGPTHWKKLSATEFEKFCTQLLIHLGFDNVRRLGASGDKGRDVICERTIEFAPGISGRYLWLIQCKHCPDGLQKAQLLQALAAAVEHRCDFWWLMTSARMTPALADWLKARERTANYPFRIGYLDREALAQFVAQFPRLAIEYFPENLDAMQHALVLAMAKMSKGQYMQASQLLQEKDDGSNPRVPYLLACCFSMIASQSSTKADSVARAFYYLAESAKRGYVGYILDRFGWPRGKCLFEIHRDPELQFVKQWNCKRFNRIFRKPRHKHGDSGGGGGCFAGGTLVQLPRDKELPIALVKQDQEIVALHVGPDVFHSRVKAISKVRVFQCLLINSELTTTPDHPLHTICGWRRADALRVGDMLTTIRGPALISSIDYVEGPIGVYNLSLSGRPYYYANQYLVHNDKLLIAV